MRWRVTPNKITVLRVLLAGVAVGIYASGAHGNAAIFGFAGLALTVAAVGLDGVDGYLARRLNLATPLGAQLDILGDRVIENLFFIYFAVSGEILLWVPIIFFVRGALTDFLRGIAAVRGGAGMHGREAAMFRRNWMLTERWSSRIVAGRISRAAYAALKCFCFCALGLEWTMFHAQSLMPPGIRFGIRLTVDGIVAATIAFCIVRAVPVLWEGARDFLAMTRPSGRAGAVKKLQTLRATARPAATGR
jgi:phosphatidylglycerophosphate synthase